MRPPISSSRIRSPRAISKGGRWAAALPDAFAPTSSPAAWILRVHALPERALPREPCSWVQNLRRDRTGLMFGDYSIGDLGSIFVMQGFAGLILFSVYVLMALGLAIIFGQMGVINMAHGEFMILGAYVTWITSNFFQAFLPGLFAGYFFLAMILAFIASGALGMLVEWALIRHLYKRPLDTLLATWGLSLILQQAYRSVFGAREVGVELPEWMLGSWQVTDAIQG